jgi:hypothetical protein
VGKGKGRAEMSIARGVEDETCGTEEILEGLVRGSRKGKPKSYGSLPVWLDRRADQFQTRRYL